MNLFIIPSWYPSASNPSYGIFVKEQIEMMANERPEWKIGVSTWGQGDIKKLLWVKDHFRNIGKFHEHKLDEAQVIDKKDYTEYYQPALSWTKKVLKGNLGEVIRCNELNFQRHTKTHGKPDVLMIQASYPGVFIADHLSKKFDVPTYLHIRLGGFMFENMLKQLGSMKENLLKAISQVNTIVTTSKFHAGEIQNGISNIKVLHNPVDLDFFDLSNKSSDYAIAIGRLEEEKGFELLIEAIATISSIKLRIVGSGSQKAVLVQKVKRLGLENRIEFVGEADRKEVRELVKKSRFLVLPSNYETFGNVLLEAIACGKPIIATKCGGPEEIVTSQVGYLADSNIQDLTEKIGMMDKNYGQFKASEIRRFAEENYSSKVWITKLERLLRSTYEV